MLQGSGAAGSTRGGMLILYRVFPQPPEEVIHSSTAPIPAVAPEILPHYGCGIFFPVPIFTPFPRPKLV